MKLLAVAVEEAQDSSLPRLPYVLEESHSVLEIASRQGTRSANVEATQAKTEIMASLESTNMVHLACHGIQHSTEPHRSHFCLGSGELTVSELMEMDLKEAFFAFLSACETARGDQKHADEAVHLAATMLFAGFKSVVATMW
jgi:CHAT domain-containing protein